MFVGESMAIGCLGRFSHAQTQSSSFPCLSCLSLCLFAGQGHVHRGRQVPARTGQCVSISVHMLLFVCVCVCAGSCMSALSARSPSCRLVSLDVPSQPRPPPLRQVLTPSFVAIFGLAPQHTSDQSWTLLAAAEAKVAPPANFFIDEEGLATVPYVGPPDPAIFS